MFSTNSEARFSFQRNNMWDSGRFNTEKRCVLITSACKVFEDEVE